MIVIILFTQHSSYLSSKITLSYTATHQNIPFLVPISYVLPVERWEAGFKSVHILLAENIKSG